MLELVYFLSAMLLPLIFAGRVFYSAVQAAFEPTVDTCTDCRHSLADHAVERKLRLVA